MSPLTVRDALTAIAKEAGVDPAEHLRVWLGSHFEPALPERYRRLVTEVVFQLPAEWDAHCVWSVSVDFGSNSLGFGSALRFEEEEANAGDTQRWEITLYPGLLDPLSDSACRWVIAHEFGHVASGFPTGSLTIGETPITRVKGTVDCYEETPSKEVHEGAANGIALKWGFKSEQEEFLRSLH